MKPLPIILLTLLVSVSLSDKTAKSSSAHKGDGGTSGSQQLRVVMSETTMASFKKLSVLKSSGQVLSFGIKNDINTPDDVKKRLLEALSPPFSRISIGNNSSESGNRGDGLTMIFDLRFTLPIMSPCNNTVQISGTFIDANGKVIQIFNGSGLSHRPYGSFSTHFPAALTAAFNEFSNNLSSATNLTAISSSTSSLPTASAAGTSGKVEIQSSGAETALAMDRNKERTESDTAALFAGTWTGTVTARAYVFLAGNVAFSSTYSLQISPNEKAISMEEKRDEGAYAIRQAQFACRRQGDSLVWSYEQDHFITGMCTLRINSNGTAALTGERVQHNWGLGKDIFKINGTLTREGVATTSPTSRKRGQPESDTAAATAFASPKSQKGMTQDEVESLLEGKGDSAQSDIPRGIYLLENEYTFNVLDSVYYDASNHQLSLIGHFDKRFSGRRTPYLQNLAVLLESPNPQFSLAWTADSEKRIDGLFAHHISQSEADSITDKWGKPYDNEGNLTKAGKYLFPALGVSPIFGNQLPGSMGVEVAAEPNTLSVRVSKVIPNSPAAAAGLQAGDIIKTINATPPFSPTEFDHFIRLRGAGGSVPTEFIHSASGKHYSRLITLAASDDHNVWRAATDPHSVARALYFAAGDNKAGQCIDMIGTIDRVNAKYHVPDEVSGNMERGLYYMLGLWNDVLAAQKAGESDAVKMAFTTKFCGALDETFGFDGHPVMDAFKRAISGGDKRAAINAAMAEFKRHFLPKLEALSDPIFQRPEGLQIAPELVEDQFHIHPEMVPQYLGIDKHSLLARTMFSSDYLCKRLMNRAELKQTIPNYQTAFEFEVKHPEFRHTTGNYRIWISVDKMDTPQSPSGNTLSFRDVKMRFNIREESGRASDGSGKDLPNKSGSYEELLTSLWDNLEEEYPTLHELHESAKLAAAAKWILLQNSSVTLPKEGRVSWQGPSKVPGLVFFEMTPDSSRATKTKVTIIANGGVSLTPFPQAGVNNSNVSGQTSANLFPSDSSVVDLSGLGSTPTLFTHEEQDNLANQIFHKKITVPEVHSVGWVKSFTKGQNTYDSVSVALNQLKGTKPQDVEQDIHLRQKLERIQQVSLHLAQTEHAINTLDEKTTNQVHEFQDLQKEIAEDRDNFYEHLFSFTADTMLEAKSSLKNHREIAEAGEFASEIKEDVDYFEDLKASILSRSAPMASLEAGVAYVKRFSEDLQKISGRLNAKSAGRYFKEVTKAKELEDILWMEAEFAKLNFVTDVKVEDLQNSNDATRAALKEKLLPLQRQYTDELDSLCNDSQIKDFVAEKNQKQ
jgi:PDZ domain